MLDAENSLIKTKSGYYQRCQTGVKLREELAAAQNLLNELSASLLYVTSLTSTAASGGTSTSSPLPNINVTLSNSAVIQTAGSAANLAPDGSDLSADASTSSAGASSTSNQLAKQRAKVERLEKQLSDNDKKVSVIYRLSSILRRN